MNADFEVELAHAGGKYHRLPAYEALNHRLAPHLLWLAQPGDALLLDEPWAGPLLAEAELRDVEVINPKKITPQSTRVFTPWGWTPSAIALGGQVGAMVQPIPISVVKRVNTKIWSFELERELGLLLPGSALCDSFEELERTVEHACPAPDDKWVVKSPYGFAARDRVLGRGPTIAEPQAKWCRRRLAGGETLIFQPWLDVVREYGVVIKIDPAGEPDILGISDVQANGAGTAMGYILGRPPAPDRVHQLERVARIVCERLFAEGYHGPVGIDALEHTGGLHPLLEVNARYTMGFVAVAVEQRLKPSTPTLWSLKPE
jgi:hypothetical protein